MRQTLPDDFWVLHTNMNCIFPLNVTINYISVDPSPIKKEDILKIHQYLMVRNNIKKYLGLLKKCPWLLTSIVNASDNIKCVSLNN